MELVQVRGNGLVEAIFMRARVVVLENGMDAREEFIEHLQASGGAMWSSSCA